MRFFTKIRTAIFLVLFSFICVAAQDDFADPISDSALANVGLPGGALRVREQNVPPEISKIFSMFLEKEPRFKQGATEVIVWGGKDYRRANAAKMRAQVESDLKSAGWDYQISGQEKDTTFFSAIKKNPRQNIFGLWAVTDDVLMLSMMEVLVVNQASNVSGDSNNPEVSIKSNVSIQTTRANNISAGGETFNLAASANFVNVMGAAMPKLPSFPSLPKKANRLRGYVKDFNGKPLQGAYIGIRSSAVGGFYSGASAETDANGYYEIDLPLGAVHYYAAGYTIDYGEGRAAVGLHPADGKADSFASQVGAVENFVLVTYGIADRDGMSEKPWNSSNYYGGSVRVSYDISSGDMWATKGSLPANSEIEITLTPDGELYDGSAGKSFTVRRPLGGINNFNINNIPIGRYKISARLANGKQLKMRKTGYDATPLFGLQPAEAIGTATILFPPNSAKPLGALPSRGDWKPADVKLELP